MNFQCPACGEYVNLNPRPSDWRGEFRTVIFCPNCNYGARHKNVPQGVCSTRPLVMISFPDRPAASLQDYECSEDQAVRFANQFSVAWSQIPTVARQVVIAHWANDPYAPYVWLINDRDEWCGRGWAAATPDGRSLFFVAPVVVEIPDQHIQLFVAHEVAHILFRAVGEEQHSLQPRTTEIAYKCERLVWDTMKAWGFDQIAAEEWMERNFEDSPAGLHKRLTPLGGADYEPTCVKNRTRIESELKSFPFPVGLEKYLNGKTDVIS